MHSHRDFTIIMCAFICVWTHLPWFSCGDQRTTVWSQLSPTTFTKVPVTELRSPGCATSHLSHLADLRYFSLVVNSILFLFMFLVSISNELYYGIFMCTWLYSYSLLSTSLPIPLLPTIPQIINPPHFHDKMFLNTLTLVSSLVNSQKGYVFVFILNSHLHT